MRLTPSLVVHTDDPDRLTAFYTALGFTELARQEGRIELEQAGLRLSVVAAGTSGSGDPGTPRGYVLCVEVDDPQSVHRALLASGGTTTPETEADGAGTLVRDPDGNPVRLQPTRREQPAEPVVSALSPAPTAPPAGSASDQEAAPGAPAPAPATVAPSGPDQTLPPGAYYTEDGVPTFDAVAERIARQSATADGNAVLDAESERGRQESDTLDKLKKAGKDRLDALRRSMGL